MTDSIQVINATRQHIEAIARFNQAMASETEDKELDWATLAAGVERMITDASLGSYLVAVDSDNNTVACLGITYEWSDWRNGLFWWIQSVYVMPEWRGRGVFSAMYEEVRRRARDSGDACGIRLYVERDNDRAYQTYLKLGMTETDYRLMEETF